MNVMSTARTGAAAALILLSFAVSACNRTPENEAPPAETAPAETAAPAPAPEPAPEPAKPVPATIPPVVARVNGQDIPKADFDRMIKQMETQAGQPVPPERRDEIYRAVLDQIVTYTALVQEARARGIDVTESEAKQAGDAKIAELRQQIPDQAAFNKAMADRGMTVTRLRADIRNDLAITKMMEAEMASAPAISDDEIKAFYDKNPDEFSGVRASHILIRPQGVDEAAKKQARATAEDLLKQVRGGADFAELAKKHSADGSAQQGGDLGFFTKSSMVKPFADAAFALQPGQVSDVVETQFGFHIIKLAERKDIAISEATPNIRDFLTAQKRDERQQAFVAAVKSKSRIEVLF
jgi:peptidyl-prolyl cis-trans isomerase C